MKKIIRLGLSVIMVVLMALSVVACGGFGFTGINPEVEEIKTKEQVYAALGTNFKMSIKSVGSDSERESGDNVVLTTMRRAGDCIVYTEQTVGEETVRTYMINENKVYELDSTGQKYVYITTIESGQESYYVGAFTTIMAISEMESVSYTKKSDITFLGRPCKKYEYEMGMKGFGGSFNSNATYIFDNATGVCFKFITSVTATAVGEGTESASGTFEVTDFAIGGVNLSAEIAKIDAQSEEGGSQGGNTSGNQGGNQGGNTSGNQGGNQGGNASTEKRITKLEDALAILGDDYSVSIKVDNFSVGAEAPEITTLSLKKVGNDFSYLCVTDGRIVGKNMVKNGLFYSFDENGALSSCDVYPPEELATETDYLEAAIVGQLLCNEYMMNYQTSTGTVLGKTCTKYTEPGYLGTTDTYVETATGLRLKEEIRLAETNAYGIIECTELKIGGNSLATDFNDITVEKWLNATNFAYYGLNGTVAEINGQFNGFIISYDYETKDAYRYEAKYFVSDLANVQTISQALYNAGAKCDYDLTEKAFAEIYDSEYSSFCAYFGASTDNYAEVRSYEAEGGGFEVTIAVAKAVN